jgi:hypothetical protein
MDEQFQNVSHSIIDKFLDKVSESCHMKKDDLWSLWREMFSFPVPKALKKSKPKTETKKSDTKAEKLESKVEPLEEKKTESKEKSPPKVAESTTVNESKEKSPPKDASHQPAPPVEKDKSPKKKRDTCQFKITRGERAGQECGKNIAKTSDQFCTNHCK